MASTTQRYLRAMLARAIRDTRLAVGWSQRQLAERAGLSRAMVGFVEAGEVNPTLDVVAAMSDALGLRVDLVMNAPFLADRRRQLEPAHARCSAYVQRRLVSHGWIVRREVEIAHGRSHGWIDLLAFQPAVEHLLVDEVKTEIEDFGRIERTLAWYEREAWRLAASFGWRPRRATGVLTVLATEANDRRLSENRDAVRAAFPVGVDLLRRLIESGDSPPRGAALALIDPRRRREDWLLRPRFQGRRTPAPYLDYADFMRTVRAA